MATVAQCEAAFGELAARLSKVDSDNKRKVLDRTVSCTMRDLGVIFSGHLRNGELTDIHQVEKSDGQLRLSLTSDDLIALTDGTLSFAKAWSNGRLRIEANVFDLLKLRALL